MGSVMAQYFELFLVAVVAFAGVILGLLSSTLRRRYWLTGYIVALILLSVLVLSQVYYPLCFIRPFNYLIAGRARFLILCLCATMGLITPLNRLKYQSQRFLVCVLTGIIVARFCMMPFLAPILLKSRHENISNRMNADNICLQTTDYTCGPAAAVTALDRLGIDANEGKLAILSHSSPITGTLPICLRNALTNEFSQLGLQCEFKRFDSIEQLKEADATLVVIKDRMFSDHCVAVLEVTDKNVVIADPSYGRQVLPYNIFAKIWRFSGITLKRNTGI